MVENDYMNEWDQRNVINENILYHINGNKIWLYERNGKQING